MRRCALGAEFGSRLRSARVWSALAESRVWEPYYTKFWLRKDLAKLDWDTSMALSWWCYFELNLDWLTAGLLASTLALGWDNLYPVTGSSALLGLLKFFEPWGFMKKDTWGGLGYCEEIWVYRGYPLPFLSGGRFCTRAGDLCRTYWDWQAGTFLLWLKLFLELCNGFLLLLDWITILVMLRQLVRGKRFGAIVLP